MKTGKTTRVIRIVSLLLALLLLAVSPVYASGNDPMPIDSLYIANYNGSVVAAGNGRLQLHFRVTGTEQLDEIGVTRIMVFESTNNQNFTWKKTYLSHNYDNMMIDNSIYNFSYVTYDGIVGRYYKCHITVEGSKNDQEDVRSFWTSATQAT